MKTRFHIIIPARYASTRLPGKPLLIIAGKPMIQWVLELACESKAESVTVATDDDKIFDAVSSMNCKVIMTAQSHESGSDRIAEAANILGLQDGEIIVNVQGDEPDMPVALINQVAQALQEKSQAVMATAWTRIEDESAFADTDIVKVVTDANDYAMYFSRAQIPWVRDRSPSGYNVVQVAKRHIGIYAYRAGFIKRFTSLACAPIEQYEKLEQLRVLWSGEKIVCVEAIEVPHISIDNEQDLARARVLFEKHDS